MTNTIVRITTDDGAVGIGAVANYTSYDYDRYTTETLRHMIPILIGRDPLDREGIRQALWPRVFPLVPGAIAAIDIALWDLYGKLEGQPIYKLLGGTRDRIRSYASTPMFDNVPAYLDFVEEMASQGFTAIKFHCWCDIDRDLELARAVRQQFGDRELAFMLDVENNYDRRTALRAARELEELDFAWFEAPLFDYDLEGYRELTSQVNIPILPSGNWLQDLPAFGEALRTQTWSVARTDVTMCGGFTGGQQAMQLVDQAGMRCEVMSWGFTLVAAANLHLMLGFNNCTYYEQAVPYEAYEYGMKDVIRTQPDGYVYAPQGAGLGLEIDWDAMHAATIHQLDSSS
jgi:L-alanine-DL-glutamate epimerase-like enolase superfamily enzyme